MRYVIMIETKEAETIMSLSDAIQDSTADFYEGDAINPDFLAMDETREAYDGGGFKVSFQRTE